MLTVEALEKAYAGGGLLYLYSVGYNQPLYNPALHGLWTYVELRELPTWLLLYRVGCLALAYAFLWLARSRFGSR